MQAKAILLVTSIKRKQWLSIVVRAAGCYCLSQPHSYNAFKQQQTAREQSQMFFSESYFMVQSQWAETSKRQTNFQGHPQLYRELEPSLGYMRSCLTKAINIYYKAHLGQRDGSAVKGTSWQAWWLSSIPKTYMMEQENQLPPAILWPPHMCHGTCMRTHTHNQSINQPKYNKAHLQCAKNHSG